MKTTGKGNKKWIRAVCEPVVVNGKVVKFSGSFQDISDRKQIEETAQENEKKLKQILGVVPDYVMTANPKASLTE